MPPTSRSGRSLSRRVVRLASSQGASRAAASPSPLPDRSQRRRHPLAAARRPPPAGSVRSPPPLPPPDASALVSRGGRDGERGLPTPKGGPLAGAGVSVAALDLRSGQDELDRPRPADSGGRPSSPHHLFARVRDDPRSLLDTVRGTGQPRLRRPSARPHVRDGGSRVPGRNRGSADAPCQPTAETPPDLRALDPEDDQDAGRGRSVPAAKPAPDQQASRGRHD